MTIRDYTTGIQHLGIPTKNMEASMNFFRELGFELAHSGMNGKNHINFVRLGDFVVELYENDAAAGAYGAIEHVALNVTDIQAVYDLICEKGLNTLNDEIHYLPLWENGVKYFTIEGPDREKVEFSQFL